MEIKFRIWDKANNRFSSSEHIHISTDGIILNMTYDQDNGYYDISNNMELSIYTGMKDKNGIDIYEGDFIIDDVGREWLIKYNNRFCGFMFYYLKGMNQFQYFAEFNPRQKPLEINGNVYEQPNRIKP